MLSRFLRSLARPRGAPDAASGTVRRMLNVGGNSKSIPIPAHFDGWEHLLLDIDSRGDPDIVCDARELASLPPGQFDAVYCSHNLEHYYGHEADKVLRGFLHVLKADGFSQIRVPDLQAVMQRVVDANMDIEEVLYQSPAGPITVRDVIYGFGEEIERSGRDFYGHKTGFTPKSLARTLSCAGFLDTHTFVAPEVFEIMAFAFKSVPTPAQRALLNLPAA